VVTRNSDVACGGEVDWWKFELDETYPWVQRPITARVTLKVDDTPPQGGDTGNLDLCVFNNGALIECSERGSTLDETVALMAADEATYVQAYHLNIRIKGQGLHVNSYTLIIEGHVPVSGSPNL
jgi:hypothetical protein